MDVHTLPDISNKVDALLITHAINTKVARHRDNVILAYALFLFSFPLGLHNFYVGRENLGWLEMLLCALSIPAMIAGSWIALAALVPIGLLWLWDLFTLGPWIDRRTQELTLKFTKRFHKLLEHHNYDLEAARVAFID